jgi:Xaa-Pro dipeptidase
MAESGHDALLLTPGANLAYFTGVSWWPSERLFACLIPRDGEPAYVSPAFEEARARESIPEGTRVFAWQESEDPTRFVASFLDERGIASGRIAVDPACPVLFQDRLARAAASARLESGHPVTSAVRSRKDVKELALLRRASEITKLALRAVLSSLEEGLGETDLVRRMSDAHSKLGGSSPWALVLFGPNAAFPHGT